MYYEMLGKSVKATPSSVFNLISSRGLCEVTNCDCGGRMSYFIETTAVQLYVLSSDMLH